MITKFRFAILAISLVALAFLGWGCNKSTENVERRTNNGRKNPVVQQQQTTTTITTTAEDATAEEPTALAYLLLAEGAKVTVTRDGSSMDGVSEMELLTGDTIEVTAGDAYLQYPDTGMSALQAGTKVTIIPDGDSTNGLGAKIILEAGKVWTRLERLLGRDETFSVESSDVVATVRGTAFGVSLIDGDVDVTVADHQVRVATKTMLNTGKLLTESVLLAAGNGIRLNPLELVKTADIRAIMQKRLRVLSAMEKKDEGYLFGTRKILPERLKRPAMPFRWSAAMVLRPELLQSLTAEQLRRIKANALWLQQNATELKQAEAIYRTRSIRPLFMPPLRSVNLLDQTPTTTPSVRGPSS